MNKPIIKTFKLEILTPVHVGMAQEKSYLRGIDYVYKDNKAWFLNLDKIMKQINEKELKMFSGLLASGNIEQIEQYYIKNGFLKNDFIYPEKTKNIYIPENSEGKINRLFCTGTGQYGIPGSSLKGAIRSVLYNLAVKKFSRNQVFDFFDNPKKVSENPLRFIQITDCMFHESDCTTITPVKVFSAEGIAQNPHGEWKDRNRGGHNRNFNKEKFINYYESFIPYKYSDVRISINSRIKEKLNFFEPEELIETISKHTEKYLDKEIEFFEKYKNDALKGIIDVYNELMVENNEEGCCVLNVGAGVGFHAITGDWQHKDHLIDKIGTGQRGQKKAYNNHFKNSAKTRKLSFEKSKNGWEFLPMGFIKLYTAEAWEKADIQDSEEPSDTQDLIQEANTEAVEKPEQETPKEPEYYTGPIKPNAGPVIAEVIVSSIPNKVKLFIKNYSEVIEMRGYSTPLEKGTLVKVRLNQVNKKGKILQVGFIKIL